MAQCFSLRPAWCMNIWRLICTWSPLKASVYFHSKRNLVCVCWDCCMLWYKVRLVRTMGRFLFKLCLIQTETPIQEHECLLQEWLYINCSIQLSGRYASKGCKGKTPGNKWKVNWGHFTSLTQLAVGKQTTAFCYRDIPVSNFIFG